MHNFKAVIITGLKSGMAVPRPFALISRPPTSGLGVVKTTITHNRKSAVSCLTLELHHFR